MSADRHFLSGGGKMGAHMRAHHWATSPLGPPERWPSSLRTTVSLLLNSRFPMFAAWGPELGFLYNDPYAEILGAKHPAALGRRFAEVWAEIWTDIAPLVERALAGQATFHEDLPLTMVRKGYEEQTYFTFSYSPVRDETGRVGGMFCACTETTAEVQARSSLKAEQERLRQLFHQAPGFMAVVRGQDHVFEITNAAYLQLVGHRDLVGKPARQALPDVEGQGFFELLDRVYETGEPFVGTRLPVRVKRNPSSSPEERFVDFVYQPITGTGGEVSGIFVEGTDVTDAVRSEQALRASEERLRVAQQVGSIGSFELVPATGMLYPSEEFCRLWGLTTCSGMPVDDALALIHPDDRERVVTGRTNLPHDALNYTEYRIVRPDTGEVRWMARRGEAVQHEQGARYLGVSFDITDLKVAQEALVAETQALEVLNRTGSAVAAELDLEKLVQAVVDAGVELTGAQFGAFFYNVLDEKAASYMLYALSGAERSQFESFGMPRATSVFAPTFRGEGVIRSADILADPRYGKHDPHYGMPKGHLPVRSYLAVPVTSRTGEVIGGLFFGHEDAGVFGERSERVMMGLAAQAAIGIDNARLFEAVQRANADLEERVRERTAELEQAHEALRQSQKMEAVGQLTGGIAHDFNNMLAVVIGSLDLLGRRIGTGDARAKRHVDAATDGARRAALLTQRLLAFSRQQPLRPEPIEANKLVAGMSDLLRHSLGADVQLETVLAGGLWRTHADPNQLENVILNLAVNARDAMPEGGRLTIETQNAHLDARYAAAHLGVTPGQYVLIAVTDTGTGMPQEVIAKAFDPFFTTKEVGKGTGLGLSQVYGFVKQSGGHVKIYSEPGQGTTVKVYLPRYLGAADESKEAERPEDLPLGESQEVVLVVEDEPAVRQFSVDALSELGYRVLEADGAQAALRLLDTRPEIALMFTDVVMPEVNGAKLAEEARRRRPGLKILFTTGYTRNAVVHNGVLDPGVQMIGKPFTIEELAAKVREVLDTPARSG
ncbi:MAG TPA: ATP-binding protein [Mesorhizobium sp.]|jgi:PAS domain S-box-containing protein|nr:ATP-binding protein [Mesorhizobium sp.]